MYMTHLQKEPKRTLFCSLKAATVLNNLVVHTNQMKHC